MKALIILGTCRKLATQISYRKLALHQSSYQMKFLPALLLSITLIVASPNVEKRGWGSMIGDLAGAAGRGVDDLAQVSDDAARAADLFVAPNTAGRIGSNDLLTGQTLYADMPNMQPPKFDPRAPIYPGMADEFPPVEDILRQAQANKPGRQTNGWSNDGVYVPGSSSKQIVPEPAYYKNLHKALDDGDFQFAEMILKNSDRFSPEAYKYVVGTIIKKGDEDLLRYVLSKQTRSVDDDLKLMSYARNTHSGSDKGEITSVIIAREMPPANRMAAQDKALELADKTGKSYWTEIAADIQVTSPASAKGLADDVPTAPAKDLADDVPTAPAKDLADDLPTAPAKSQKRARGYTPGESVRHKLRRNPNFLFSKQSIKPATEVPQKVAQVPTKRPLLRKLFSNQRQRASRNVAGQQTRRFYRSKKPKLATVPEDKVFV